MNEINPDIRDTINQIEDIRDLQTITDIIKHRSKELSNKTKRGLKVGDKVYINGRSKVTRGVVSKINRTRASIKCKMTKYSVPFSMIRKEL